MLSLLLVFHLLLGSSLCERPLALSQESLPHFTIHPLREMLTFFLVPPHPCAENSEWQVFAQTKGGADWREVVLPARLDLTVSPFGTPTFSDTLSPFWIEVSREERKVEVSVWVDLKELGGVRCVETFSLPLQRVKPTEERGSLSLQKLRQVQWMGPDRLLRSLAKESPPERLMGSGVSGERLLLSPRNWLIYNGESWEQQEVLSPEEKRPIARVVGVGETLTLEEWEGNRYYQVALSPALLPVWKCRPEELFTSLRVRSENQVSCMLEKQCLVLRTGDWVCKRGGKWKVLRKKEERESFQRGEIEGELFLFEQIEMRQGQKIIRGTLFDPSRTQMTPVELAVSSPRKKGKAA